jgi:hypothetical protein
MRERAEFFRESNSIPKDKIIVLVYEGNNTEKIYFEKFKEDSKFDNEKIHLHSLARKKRDGKSAPKHVFNKLKREAKDEYNFDREDELWMLIDRDKWIDIPEISALCKKEGNFYLALSNPCFEFWLLLHIKDISDYSDQVLNDIFENKYVTSNKTYLEKLLGEILDHGYNKSKPRPQRFFPYITDAIERARKLDILGEEYPTQLGSHVYKLVEKLLK